MLVYIADVSLISILCFLTNLASNACAPGKLDKGPKNRSVLHHLDQEMALWDKERKKERHY